MKPPLGFSSWLEVQPYLKKRASQIFSLIANYATQSYRSGGVSQTFPQTHTLTRSTSRYVWDASGQLTAIAVDNPCYEYDPATGAAKGLFLNPESVTNLFLGAMDSSNIYKYLSAEYDCTIAPATNGLITGKGSTIAGVIGSKTSVYLLDYAFAGTDEATISFIVDFSGLGSQYFFLYKQLASHEAPAGRTFFSYSSGELSLASSEFPVLVTHLYDAVYRLTFTSQSTANGSRVYFGISSSGNGEANLTSAASIDLLYIGIQDEGSAIIDTTSSAVTVAADVCDLAALPSDYGTIGCFVINYSDPFVGSAIREMLGDGANAFFQLSADNLTVSATDGTNTASTSVTATGKNKVAVAWDSTTLKICANGGTVVTATHNGNLGSFASPPRLARGVAAWYSLLQYLPSTNTGNVIATDAKMQELTA